jgi:hypothetical protein
VTITLPDEILEELDLDVIEDDLHIPGWNGLTTLAIMAA